MPPSFMARAYWFGRFGSERRMANNTVNLDALIPREDFEPDATQTGSSGGNPRTTISISDLAKNGFFQNSLRKPDFQRETTYWSPAKVYDLVHSFLDRDLIPAVILWVRGDEIFVIDGAHRLSALIAWVRDDYGDGADSNRFFGAGASDEQRAIAEKTRKMIKKDIGTYAEYSGLVGQTVADPVKARRLASIGKESIIIQWVTAATPDAAQASFFKINQAAQPIDPVERRILQSRTSPNAIASRCIVRGGTGHKYWAAFGVPARERIEELGASLYKILYSPPHKQPVTTADQPIAGQGYNSLPFVFDLVSLCNGLKIPDSSTARSTSPPLAPDMDGSVTIQMLEAVNKRLALVSTDHAGSLGFHPLIYYYARSGNFLPTAFLASLDFALRLERDDEKANFTTVRRKFEDYLLENKVFVSLAINRLGSGARSLSRITDLYWEIFVLLKDGVDSSAILARLIAQEKFLFLKIAEVPPPSAELPQSPRGASRLSKSAAFIRESMTNPLRCPVCTGAIHSNSIQFDHVVRKSEGGDNQSQNLMPMHPYCNSTIKH